MDAIEFAINHDDGKNTQDLHLAEITLTGVSRTGKTPLSMYLAVLGWKVANVPIIIGAPFPVELSLIDRNRIFGLTMDYEQLVQYRRKRQERMGMIYPPNYSKSKTVFNELEYAYNACKQHHFSIIDVTNKPIESSASEIIERMTYRFKEYSL
jgi:regulator of PEP synthase PpsR (kinase-PPPase family)